MNKNDCNIKLSPKQKKRLKRIYKSETGRVARRVHIVLLYSEGFTMEQIAQICMCDRHMVAEALQRFQKHAYQGLYDKERPGRLRALSKEDEEFILAVLRQNPHDFGYFATVWTISLIMELLKDYRGKTVGENAVRSMLDRIGWEFRRPKHIPPHVSPLPPEEKEEVLRLLTNPGPNEVLLFGDEADFEWLPYIIGAWMPKGEQLEIPTPGKNKVVCCFGFFNPHTKEFFYKLVHTRHNKTAKNFIAMLHQLRAQFPGCVIHIVVDNASIHDPHTKLLKQFRMTYGDQIVVHFLPKHSPILNPIERFWRFLKQRICANWLYDSVSALVESFRSFIWQYREHNVVYNFSLANIISIWKNHPVIEETPAIVHA